MSVISLCLCMRWKNKIYIDKRLQVVFQIDGLNVESNYVKENHSKSSIDTDGYMHGHFKLRVTLKINMKEIM